MKLNNKGYMLVEIIVSFSLAFAIIISLTNLVLKFKDTSEDIYYETKYLKDKALITRNIMGDFEKIVITDVTTEDSKTIKLDYKIYNEDDTITFGTRAIKINNNTITYGEFTTDFVKSDSSYYTKTLESSLIVGDIKDCSNLRNEYFCATIEVTSMYGDENYDLTLFSVNLDTEK